MGARARSRPDWSLSSREAIRADLDWVGWFGWFAHSCGAKQSSGSPRTSHNVGSAGSDLPMPFAHRSPHIHWKTSAFLAAVRTTGFAASSLLMRARLRVRRSTSDRIYAQDAISEHQAPDAFYPGEICAATSSRTLASCSANAQGSSRGQLAVSSRRAASAAST
jgi:hypothetical protein